MDIKEQVFQIAKNAKEAASAVANLSSAEKDEALVEMAEQLIHHTDTSSRKTRRTSSTRGERASRRP